MSQLHLAPAEGAVVIRRRPPRFTGLLVSLSIFRPIELHLQAAGRLGREQAAFLCGYVVSRSVGLVTTALLPRTQNHLAGCHVSLGTMARCVDQVRRTRQLFLAQIHTHPGRHCGHSITDDDWAICDSPGFFSIVVPCFARDGLAWLFSGGAAVYERTEAAEWQLLPTAEVRRRFIAISAYRPVA